METTHGLTAEWVSGRGIIVRNAAGVKVKVSFAGTLDNRTCYAYTEDGFIGGWQYPHRKESFCALAASINRGILYSSLDELPKRGV